MRLFNARVHAVLELRFNNTFSVLVVGYGLQDLILNHLISAVDSKSSTPTTPRGS